MKFKNLDLKDLKQFGDKLIHFQYCKQTPGICDYRHKFILVKNQERDLFKSFIISERNNFNNNVP